MENNLVNMQIDESLIRECVQKQIQQAIVRELGDSSKYMEELINLALKQKVDEMGNPTNSSWYKDTFIDYLFRTTLREAATKAFKEYMDSKSIEFKKEFKNFFKRKEVKEKVMNAYLDFGLKQLNGYSTNINIGICKEGT